MELKNVLPVGVWQSILLLFALHCRVYEAVNSEGMALQAFKKRLDDSVGALSNWNDSDVTPCNWKGVVCSNLTNVVIFITLPHRNLSGTISSQLSDLKNLQQLNLRNNAIAGYIQPALATLKELRVLELADNKLEGPIPESLSSLTSLTYFNVSNNQLSGKVPEGTLLRFNGSSYLGNAKLCGVAGIGLSPCTPSPALAPAPAPGPSRPVRSNQASLSLVQILLMSVGLFLAFKFGIAVLLIMRWLRKDNEVEINLGKGGKIVMFQGSTNVPTSRELLNAVRQIRKKHIIGEGGYGVVYKLEVKSHPPLAVKKLKTCLESERSFENELDTLGTVKHRNLVKLRGFCSSPSVKLLIYDFLPGGNLEQLLHGKKKEDDIVVDWPIRYRIALGVARGLSYLHHGSAPRVIHGDVSSSNILLDTEFEPYLSDFGLAKLVTTNDTHVSVTVGGTFGYVAPEFAKSGRANEKVDVYSYGVILLELLSGRRAVDESLPDDEYTNLAGWVRELHNNGNVREIIDQNLKEVVAGVELDLLLEVAYHCISLNPHDRPQMNKVVETLELLVETGLSPTGTSLRPSQDDSVRPGYKEPPSKPSASDVPGFRPVGGYYIFDT